MRDSTAWVTVLLTTVAAWLVGLYLMQNAPNPKLAVGLVMPALAAIYALVWLGTTLLVREYRLERWKSSTLNEAHLGYLNLAAGVLYLLIFFFVPQKYFLFEWWVLYLTLGIALFTTSILQVLWPHLKWVPEWTREKRKEARG